MGLVLAWVVLAPADPPRRISGQSRYFKFIAPSPTVRRKHSKNLPVEVPNDILNYIADSLEAGEKCFINKLTLEVITCPDSILIEDEEAEPWREDLEKINNDPENYIEIDKMNSTKSYKLMESFIDSLKDSRAKEKLIHSIDGHKPFANFKLQIENSNERELWFAFKRQKNIEWVNEQLSSIPQ